LIGCGSTAQAEFHEIVGHRRIFATALVISGHPLASQASTAVTAASTARASGSEYPDCATCAGADDETAIEVAALKQVPLRQISSCQSP
jgi:hypothetical protein